MPGVLVAAGGSPTLNSGVNLFPEGLADVFRRKKKQKRFRLVLSLLRGPQACGQCCVHLAGGSAELALPCFPGAHKCSLAVCMLRLTLRVSSCTHAGSVCSVFPCSGSFTLGSVFRSELYLAHWTVHSCVLAVDSRLLPFRP